jgi:ribosome-associated protein
MAIEIAKAAENRGALDLMILDMREVMTITDYFVICHGRSKVHCQALAEHIEEELSKQDVHAKHREGLKDGIWIILDYLDVVVHIFEEEARNFYDLRRLWVDAVEVPVPEMV